MLWRSQRAAAILGLLPAIAAASSGIIQVTGIRAWTHADVTRVIIQTTGPVDYKSDRAQNPERLFFDLLQAQPWIAQKRLASVQLSGGLVHRVRVAETAPGTTRIVFDLAGPAEFNITRLVAPDRMVVELRPRKKPAGESVCRSRGRGAGAARRVFAIPPGACAGADSDATRAAGAGVHGASAGFLFPGSIAIDDDQAGERHECAECRDREGKAPRPCPLACCQPAHPAVLDAAPHPSTDATRSLTRALGLKVNRIVIDAGHGGHDDGTIGPHGVLEKDVVLDVALRLSKLVQERMGAEVDSDAVRRHVHSAA